MPVTFDHMTHLRASGLTDETIALANIRSAENGEIAKILKWRPSNYSFGSGIVFPYFKSNGTCNGYERVRLDFPRPNQDGKTVKYESPRSSLNRPYFGPRFTANVKSDSPTIITEGEKKTLALDQIGYPTVGLPGVWGFAEPKPRTQAGNKYGKLKLHADLRVMDWKGRRVVVVFDSDAAENRQVRLAEHRLSELMTEAGAAVTIARLPQVGIGKTGVDDFLVHHGDTGLEKLRTIINGAEVAEKPDELTSLEIAKELIADQFTVEGYKAIVYHNSEYYRWAGNYYVRVDRDELVPRVQKWLNEHGHKASSSFAREIANSLQAEAVQDFSRTPPFFLDWAPRDSRFTPENTLVGRNMMLSLPSLESGEPVHRDPYPGLFNVNGLDYDINLDAPAPENFLRFLQSIWPDDPQSIETLLEWIGYLLTPDTRQQKMLLCVGPKRSGKGTISRVVQGLVGAGNCVSPTLASLATNFGLSPLVNKTVAIVSDARLSGKTDHSIVTERLLSITGEDAQTIDRKYLPPITTQLKTRFCVFTNELPRMGDSSGALAGRMIVLRMRRSFFGVEDHGLSERLLAERPGILLMAIEGWRRLRQRGRFVQPDSAASLVEQLEEITSPVGAFVADRCELAQDATVSVQEIFDAWRQWCEASGKSWTGDRQTFGRDLRSAVPDIEDTRPNVNGRRERHYRGIRLAK
ncbi:MAG TPA: phage/plasmid primase, P4 family [Phycisphaerae bacterium]|nr:phage/plasmid primase, P4 family [Phycisphaerae bacterium]